MLPADFPSSHPSASVATAGHGSSRRRGRAAARLYLAAVLAAGSVPIEGCRPPSPANLQAGTHQPPTFAEVYRALGVAGLGGVDIGVGTTYAEITRGRPRSRYEPLFGRTEALPAGEVWYFFDVGRRRRELRPGDPRRAPYPLPDTLSPDAGEPMYRVRLPLGHYPSRDAERTWREAVGRLRRVPGARVTCYRYLNEGIDQTSTGVEATSPVARARGSGPATATIWLGATVARLVGRDTRQSPVPVDSAGVGVGSAADDADSVWATFMRGDAFPCPAPNDTTPLIPRGAGASAGAR